MEEKCKNCKCWHCPTELVEFNEKQKIKYGFCYNTIRPDFYCNEETEEIKHTYNTMFPENFGCIFFSSSKDKKTDFKKQQRAFLFPYPLPANKTLPC